MARLQGTPCWYELETRRGGLADAERFYAAVLGWRVADAGMEGYDYRLASVDGAMVAGMAAGQEGAEPAWTIYFAVEDADAAAAAIRDAGGEIVVEPADIPGTGRFAIAADPHGARFGVLQPEPMPGESGAGGAFDPRKTGHGAWNELMSRNPAAGFDFYAALFGWERARAVEMGEMGTYQVFAHDGVDIGGMMGLGDAPASCWLPYFATEGVEDAMRRIEEAGGKPMHGPIEVPGGAFIAVAADPQGAHFAVVGPRGAD